jgi:hypothetical protein
MEREYIMKKFLYYMVMAVGLLLCAGPAAFAEPAGVWQVISGGGDTAASTDYRLTGTIGQSPIGTVGAASLTLNGGFWQNFDNAGTCDSCRPGDANFDGIYNAVDVTIIIGYLYEGGPPPLPEIICSADPTLDCTVNIFDIVYLLKYIYMDGPPPPDCEAWYNSCGGN